MARLPAKGQLRWFMVFGVSSIKHWYLKRSRQLKPTDEEGITRNTICHYPSGEALSETRYHYKGCKIDLGTYFLWLVESIMSGIPNNSLSVPTSCVKHPATNLKEIKSISKRLP